MTDAELREKLAAALYAEHHGISEEILQADVNRIMPIIRAHVALARAAALLAASEHMCLFIEEDWTVKCSCGWSEKCNEREYAQKFAAHIRALTTADDAKALDKLVNDAVMKEHRNHVSFERNLYHILVDMPEEPATEAQMFTAMVEAATQQREKMHDIDKYVQERVEAAEEAGFQEGCAFDSEVGLGIDKPWTNPKGALARALAAAKQAGADERDQQWIDGMHAEDLSPRKPCDIAAYLKWFEGSCTSGYETELAELRTPGLHGECKVCGAKHEG